MLNKINVGVVGLGNMGIFHAQTVLMNIYNASLVAICAQNTDNDHKAYEYLSSLSDNSIAFYSDFETMLISEKLDGVLIVSSTKMHPNHIALALKYNVHIFVEKPIALDPDLAKQIGHEIEQHPDLIVQVGYMRRYDDSYLFAKHLISKGKIGSPYMVRAYSQDPITSIKHALDYCPTTGGEFVDMGVHDIDLIRWFLNSEPAEIWAIGDAYRFDEFNNWHDADTAMCMMRMLPNINGKEAVAMMLEGRIAPHGYNIETEIIGTHGILRIGSIPRRNLVEIIDGSGVVMECHKDFKDRFAQAYRAEIQAFVQAIAEFNLKSFNFSSLIKGTTHDAINNTIIAFKCRESFETRQLVKIDWTKENK